MKNGNSLEELQELEEYSRAISEMVQGNMQEGVSRIQETVSGIIDLKKICSVLFDTIKEQQHQLDELARQNEELKAEVQRKTEYGDKMGSKLREYEKSDVGVREIASLLYAIKETSSQLEKEQIRFMEEKETFASERMKLEQGKRDAEERAVQRKSERDNAIRSRDHAIAQMRETGRSLEEYRERETNLLKEKASLSESVEWYRKYAAELNQKVIDFYREGIEREDSISLWQHYNTFLTGPECQRYFPEMYQEKKPGKQ